jgi:CHAD domain-containing protein
MYPQLRPSQDLVTYCGHVMEALLRDLAFGIRQTLNQPSAKSVHDLRRVCLRLRHAVRLFEAVLPERAARRVRRRLGELQDLLGAVRSCDVALDLLDHHSLKDGISDRHRKEIVQSLATQRRQSVKPLRGRLRRMQRGDTPRRWRTRLLGAA